MKIYYKRGLKIILWIIGSIFGLFLLLVIALQIPAVQQFSKNKAVAYLEGKIKTKVSINRIQIGFPKDVVLEDVYFEDQKKDTLLAGKKIIANINLFGLLNNKFDINSVELEGITANIKRNEKSEFNFDYIIKAFETPKKPNDNSPAIEFSIDKVKFNKVKFHYSDAVSKNDLKLYVNHLNTRIKTFDLQKMFFEVPKINIDGLQLFYKQAVVENTVSSRKAKSNSIDVKLKLGIVDLSNAFIDYQDEGSKITTNYALKKLFAKVNTIDWNVNLIDLEKIEITEATGAFNFGQITKQEGPTISDSKSNDWKVKLNDVALEKVNFNFDDNNSIPLKKGFDYNHLNFQNLNLDANKFEYNSQTMSGKINASNFDEKSGLKVVSLKTVFFYSQQLVSLKELYLKTPLTLLRNEIIISYPSLESVSENLGTLNIKANLIQSRLGFKDVSLFVPSVSNTTLFKENPNAILLLNTTVSGKLSNLSIPKLQVSGIGKTKIDASGKITGLPDYKKAYFDLNIKNFQSSAKDIYSFVPKNTIPNSIQLPADFSTKGTFKGTISNFNTNMNLISSSGNAKIKGTFDQRIKDKETYNFDASLDNLDLGKIFKNDSIGKISVTTTIKGIGLNPKTAKAKFEALIRKADFNNYTYQNLVTNGNISNGLYNVTATAKDPNLKFDLISSGSFKDKYPKGILNLNVDIADLDKLNLHAGPMKIRGVLDADIQSADLDYLNGKASIHNLIIANATEQFATDSINVVAVSTVEKNSIVLNSQFMDAEIVGKYKLSTMANSIKNSISNYYNLKSSSKKIAHDKQQLAFKINVKSSPIIVKLIPELKSIEPIAINGRYNSVNDTIVLKGSIPKLIYGTNTISNAVIKVDTKDNTLLYSLVVDEIQNAQFKLPHSSITGKVADNIVDYTLQLKDLKDKERYLIVGNLKSRDDYNEISLDPKKLLLNYESWIISNDNLIRFGDNGIYVSNFELNKDENNLKIQSQSEVKNAPLAIEFKNFEIKTITNIVQVKDLEMNGKINGNALFKNITTKPLFTADLKIENFTVQKDTLGIVNIKVDNYTANTYNAKIEITGQDNQVNLDGNYIANDSSLDMNLDVQKLNLKSIQGFSMNYITESIGFLTGKFKISGNTSQPKMIGELQFNDIGFKVIPLNAKFKSMNDKIVFTDNAIVFNDFVIKDEKNNDLTLNGKINSQNYSNLGFDLIVDADNFKAVNSKAKDNNTYYGELFLDNHLQIRGTWDNPMVEGDIKINKDTKFTIVLPQDDPSIADREGIVEFIDQDQPLLNTTVSIDEKISQTEVKGINATVNIEIDKEAELSMIIDKANGDFLKLKGEAQLTGGIDPSGKTTLTGRYELNEGSYEMNFNLIKKKFDIKKGSYILWTGEPTTADINITAIYKTETAPINLLYDQLSELTNEERNTYKQKIPFETELKMKGELLKPSISFNIILPEGNNSVSGDIITKTQAKLARLRQEPDELNKQVFALLLLNRFIGENPFSSESGGTTASAFARESASKLLSQQLNNLAADLIKGFEVDFDLNSSEDYTTGQKENKTELNVGLSKKLLNDRLKVTVGSSFGIEGPEQKDKNTNNIAGNISGEYLLSKDGRYKLRAYRKNLYQVALEGQVIETGVGFIITLDYNKFKELFQKKKAAKRKSKKKSNG